MTNDETQTAHSNDDLPVFPTSPPAIFCDADATAALFDDVLHRLATVIDIDPALHDQPSPCAGFTLVELQKHVLGWLGFFAAALTNPSATTPRPDPDAFTLPEGERASTIVEDCAATIGAAIRADAASSMVTMSSSKMSGDGVLAMALGEYIIHGWDLATATGQTYDAPEAAVGPAHEFLLGMVAPEYRGPESGFFDFEVEVPADASPLHKLLGFAGRDPNWQR